MSEEPQSEVCNVKFSWRMWDSNRTDLFDLTLYIHDKHLRSCLDGLILYHINPEQVYQYLVPILSPVADNLDFLNQWKREILFSTKECAEWES